MAENTEAGAVGLVERLEMATGPDRAIDYEIHCRDGLEGVGMYGDHPHYTSSMDAALSLVPDGNYWVGVEEPHSWRQRPAGRPGNSAHYVGKFWNAVKWCLSGGPGGNPKQWKWWEAHCDLGTQETMHRFMGHSDAGPAIALCIAALKARTAHPQERTSPASNTTPTDSTRDNARPTGSRS